MSTQLQTLHKNMPEPSFMPVRAGLLQRQCACGQHTGGGECEECRKKSECALQRAAISPAPTNTASPIVHDVLSSPGQPIDAGTRAFMEPRFGHDFSSVRVHTDARAAESARSVNALAYTVGRNVVFGAGQYALETMTGRKLMAHELTHVAQQNANGNSMWTGEIGHEGDAYEKEAEKLSTAISSASFEGVTQLPGAPVAQRASMKMMKAPDQKPDKDPCLDDCEKNFNHCLDTTNFPPACIARRSECMRGCAPKQPATSEQAPSPKVVDIRKVEISSGGRREHVDPSLVTQGIWWFNGAKPLLSPLYPTETNVDTGLPALGRFQYKITRGSDKLVLLDGTRETTSLDVMDDSKPRVKGIGASKSAKDVQLTITHTSPGAKSPEAYAANLEVRAPDHLDLLGCSHAPKGSYGYETTFKMKIRDNFGVLMPYIDVNEDFTTGTLAPGTTSEWGTALSARKKGSTITLGDAMFEDHYAADISGGAPPPSMVPRPSNPQTPLGSTLVGTFTHDWYVGSQSTGQGVHVSRHVGKLYADHGQYSAFVSPVQSPGKAASCPEEAPTKAAPAEAGKR